jgi:RHS repeat-associated protein
VPNSTKTAYDGLGRPVRTTTLHDDLPQHSTIARYEGDWTLTRTGMSADGLTPKPGSRAVKTWTDTLGRTSLMQHYTAHDLTVPIDTSYAYNARGKLSRVMDAHGNAWTYTYDSRGRLTGSTDPDMGATHFGYNSLDQQTWSQDGQGRKQYTAYDVLGRATELRDDSATGPLVAKWTFDSLPGAKGLGVAATRYNDGAAFTSEVTGYDQEYRPTGSKVTIPETVRTKGLAGTYAYATSYTETGKVQSVQLPATPGGLAPEKVITRYNGEGSPITTSGLTWYTGHTIYSQFGEVLRTASGQAPHRAWTTNEFDPNTGRMKTASAHRETQTQNLVSSLAFGYDTVGNITSLTDTGSGTGADRQCFAYDPMGRLVEAWTDVDACQSVPDRSQVATGPDGSGYWHSYRFDAIGNRTQMTVRDPASADLDDEHNYTYGTPIPGAQPAAVTQPHTLTKTVMTERATGSEITSQSTYTYDTSGNTVTRVLNGDTQKLAWDRRNKLTSVDTDNNGTSNVSYLYDASGARLIEDNGTTRTLFLGEAEITVNSAGAAVGAQRYYTHPGAPTTVRSTGGKTTGHKLTVLLTDHHNTATASVEMAAGQTVTRRRYDPYGNPRGTEPAAWPGRHTFVGTGIDDPTTGLTHIGAREYDSTTGRFISVDPIIDITDPLQMNGYAYANNSPVTLSDPDGLRPMATGGSARDEDRYDRVNGTVTVKKPGQKFMPVKDTHREASPNLPPSAHDMRYLDVNGEKFPIPTKNRQEFIEVFNRNLDSFSYQPGTRDDETSIKTSAYWATCQEVGGCEDDRYGEHLLGVVLEVGLDGNGGKRASAGKGRGRVGCGKCFLAGTDVLMADGTTKDIEDIKLGDKVQAADPETGEAGSRTVTRLIVTVDDKHFNELSIATEVGVEELTATHEHPFWSPSSNDWIEAGNLQPGTTLLTDDGDLVIVTANRPFTQHARTYNLTVSDLHTYYVLAGETPVLVHNANCIVGTRQFDHAWDQHSPGGAYHKAGKVENVFADGIDKTRFRGMVDEAIKNGTQVPRSKSDPRGGYYIDYDFGDVEVGAMGQNGMRIAVDGAGNFVTAMPKFMY